jgi:DNA-binding MarR family transcriptional regulator
MDFEQADQINRAIRTIALRHRAHAATLLARLGLHPGQEFLLMELARNGPTIQANLAEAIACEPPSVTQMVRKLEAGGYIARKPSTNDRRATVVELTEAGRELTRSLRQVWRQLAEESLAGIQGLSVDEAARVLTVIAASLNRRESLTR